MEFLLIAAAAWALSRGWTHVRADFARSRDAHAAQAARQYPEGTPAHVRTSAARRHLLGYMGREVMRGFPVWRTGLHMGMLSHRTALAHARLQHEEARDTHEELQESLRKRVAERRAQRYAGQEEAFDGGEVPEGSPAEQARAADELAERRRQREQAGEPDATSPPPGSPAPGPYAQREPYPRGAPGLDSPCPLCGSDISERCAPGCKNDRARRDWPAGDDAALPACRICGQPLRAHPHDGMYHLACAPAAPKDGAPVPTRRPDGKPETEADKRFFDLRESGYEGPVDQDGHATEQEGASDAARNPSDPVSPSPATEGAPVPATDTTFNNVHAAADQSVSAAESAGAAARRGQATALDDADAMTAAGVDAAVIDAQMALADLQDKAAKAHDAVLEQAGVVKTVLTKFHGGMQAAHDDSPGAVAVREFHAS